jgi:hypothetical protein
MMVFFAICIFISAFLLFQVEPMIGKYILPWFGGTPAVWSTVMLFFQVLLTGGYAYAYWLTGKGRRKEIVHLVLLGLTLFLMLFLGLSWKSPITPGVGLKPTGTFSPIWEIFKLLTLSVGLPYFLLASNSPLIQAWFNRAYPGRTAYRLYALSNAGSLLALVSYPVLVEPNLTLSRQGWIWSLGFAVYAGLAAYGAVKALHARRAPDAEASSATTGPTLLNYSDRSASADPPPRASAGDYLLWIALSACASILLLATTNHITQEVAVIPFLWVLPLTIYLLTFILAFSDERWYRRQLYLILFFVVTILYAWAMPQGSLNIPLKLYLFSLVLFFGCMVCHGELYRLRPHPDHLTSFYLMVSVGGAIGGILINFVAPYVFKGFWELPLGYLLCWLLFLVVSLRSDALRRSRWAFVANTVLLFSALAISGIRAILFIRADLTGSLGSWRNFYGVVRVLQFDKPGSPAYSYGLIHGITIHGRQFLEADKRDLPTAYFGPRSGIGLALQNFPKRGGGMRVGVLGLGIGTISAYGRPGDVYRFYEINPTVIQLAEGQGGYFSYLKDSRARVEVILGDARLSLEEELVGGRTQQYDVLALDVFSSDAIPVHLLDEESFDLYLKHLQPEGILAVHITNSYLDLVPVVWTLADHFNLSRVLIQNPGDPPDTFPSIWMLLARDPAVLKLPAIEAGETPLDGYTSRIRLWTDDYSNLFQILKH